MSRKSFLGLAALVASASVQAILAQAPTLTPLHANGTYELGETAAWTVAAPAGKYVYTIKRNNFDVLKTGTLELTDGPGRIEMKPDEPAMLYLEVHPEGGSANSVVHAGAAIAPWKLQPSAPRPDDFDAFWERKLKALAQIPMNPKLTPTETAKPGVELYTVKLDSVGSNVQGYLAKPAREGKFPALVIYQYAGVYALKPETVTDRAAEGWLAFDVDSHDMPPSQAAGVSPSYQKIGASSRETSYFLNMYLRDSRALDYIRTRPDWDGKTLVIMGTSMGGQQSLVTAGLNPNLTAVIVNEPAGADLNGDLHGRKAGYPNWPSDDPDVMRTAPYFDTVNFASRIKAPVLAGIGYIDTTTPPVGIWIAVNQIPAPVEVIPMVESDHNNRTPDKQGALLSRIKEVLHALVGGGEFAPDDAFARGRLK